MLTAMTREVSESLGRCELTHLPRVAIDVGRARAQHAAYEAALRGLGVRVVRAAAAPELPDAVFVEDIAVALEEGFILTRPGAESRRGEVPGVASAVRNFGWTQSVERGTLDGGDVLRIGRTFYVGRTSRTNDLGIRDFERLVRPRGYEVRPVEVRGCLHLKSAVTRVGERTLLVHPGWVPVGEFGDYERIEVDAAEPYAANALLIGDTVIYPRHFPRTRAKLEARGIRVVTVPCDELAKAEGAVTCCCIVFDDEMRG